jgi:hypothetical protein
MISKTLCLTFAASGFLWALGAPLMAQSGQPEITARFTFSRIVQAVKHSGGTAAVEAQQVEVVKGNAQIAVMFLLYEPESRNYWWALQGVTPGDPSNVLDAFLSKHRIYVLNGHVWVFGFVSPMFGGREESGQASDIADARDKAVSELQQRFSQIQGHSWNGIHQVNVGPVLGNGFMALKYSSMSEPSPKLNSVTREDGNWVAVLDGPNGDSARMTLNDNFDVVRSEIIPAK